ncbi:hypothetical protein V8C26DRAFT_358681 [Trichoderma gracile]
MATSGRFGSMLLCGLTAMKARQFLLLTRQYLAKCSRAACPGGTASRGTTKLFKRPVIRQLFVQGLLWRASEQTKVMTIELLMDLVYATAALLSLAAISFAHEHKKPPTLRLRKNIRLANRIAPCIIMFFLSMAHSLRSHDITSITLGLSGRLLHYVPCEVQEE